MSKMRPAISLSYQILIRVSRRRAAWRNNIAEVNLCILIAHAVLEVIDVLAAVGIADVHDVVASPIAALDCDGFGDRGAEKGGEDHEGGESVHFEMWREALTA